MNELVEDQPSNGTAVTNPFGTAVAPASQLNATAVAMEQRAIAEVQASFIMAQRFPRDERAAVDGIINAFGRPKLAASAQYEYSKGGSEITGPSIRAAEAIAQQWGNLDTGFSEVARFRDERGIGVSLVRAQCVDLQSRGRKYIDFHVRHWRDTQGGGYPLKSEREIYELVANQAQRRVRACILAQIPSDVVETAMKQAEATLKANVSTTPESIQIMLEGFEQFGITKEHVETRIQRRIDSITAGNMVTLRRIYVSIRDGMSSAGEWFDMGDPDPETSAAIAALNQRVTEKKNGNGASKAKATPAAAKPAAAAAKDPGPGRTFDDVMGRLQAAFDAKDVDKLDEAADLIGDVEDEAHRGELTSVYKQMRKDLQA